MPAQCVHYIAHGERFERIHLDAPDEFRGRYPGATVKINDRVATIAVIHGVVDPPLTPADVREQLAAIGVDGGAGHVGVVAPVTPRPANNPWAMQ